MDEQILVEAAPPPYIDRVLSEWWRGIDSDDGREYDEAHVQVAYPRSNGSIEYRVGRVRFYLTYQKGARYHKDAVMYTLTLDNDDDGYVVSPCPIDNHKLLLALQEL